MILLAMMEGWRQALKDVIRANVSCPFNPKLLDDYRVKALSDALKIDIANASMYFALLICVGISAAADDGELDMGGANIEAACRWTGRRGNLYKAFKDVGILEGDRDDFDNPQRFNRDVWCDYAFNVVKRRIGARERQAEKRAKDAVAKQREFDAFMSGNKTMSQVVVTRDSNE